MDNIYYLMNKDKIILEMECEIDLNYIEFQTKSIHGDYLPYGFTSPDDWIESRQIAKHRKQIREMMQEWGLNNKIGFIEFTHAASLNDTFWIKSAESDIAWDDINLYSNPFNDVIAHLAFDGAGLYGKKLDTTTPELSTSGAFEKCWKRIDSNIFLYKRGTEGYANAGYEPYSEKLTSDLLDAMNIRHVPYTLVKYHGKLASSCPIFISEDTGFVPFSAFTEKHTANPKKIMNIISNVADENRFREMIIADAISINVDRHQGNFGFLTDNETGRITDFAPLFDHNMSQLPGLMKGDDAEKYLLSQGPRIGDDFVRMAQAVMTPLLRSILINLKDFDYTNPGFGYPDWKIKTLNRLKNKQIDKILGIGIN